MGLVSLVFIATFFLISNHASALGSLDGLPRSENFEDRGCVGGDFCHIKIKYKCLSTSTVVSFVNDVADKTITADISFRYTSRTSGPRGQFIAFSGDGCRSLGSFNLLSVILSPDLALNYMVSCGVTVERDFRENEQSRIVRVLNAALSCCDSSVGSPEAFHDISICEAYLGSMQQLGNGPVQYED